MAVAGRPRVADRRVLVVRRRPRPVLWLGPVKTDTGAGPLFACEPCIRHLAKRVLRHHMNNDQAPPR